MHWVPACAGMTVWVPAYAGMTVWVPAYAGMTGVTEMDEKPANPTPANPRVATCQVGLSCGHD